MAIPNSRKKSEVINIRVDTSQLALIDKATAILKKDRSSFILDVVNREAIDAILDRRLFLLDEAQYNELERIFNSPARKLPRLKALLHKKAAWEK